MHCLFWCQFILYFLYFLLCRNCLHCQFGLYCSVRDAAHFQNGWIFGKVSNGLWPPPPLIFGKLYCGFCNKSAYMFIWRDICVLYVPISHEMHVVQQFNMVLPLNWLKTYPKKTQGGPTWLIILYYTHGKCFRVIWGLPGQHLVRSSFYPSRPLWGSKNHNFAILKFF